MADGDQITEDNQQSESVITPNDTEIDETKNEDENIISEKQKEKKIELEEVKDPPVEENDDNQQDDDDDDDNDDDDYPEEDEDEPNFSDPEGYIDEIDEEELLGDILAEQPNAADGIDAIIVVDGIPQVGEQRWELLYKVIRSIFDKFGEIASEHFPKDADGKTKGFVFFEYTNASSAALAIQTTNGYKLDKNHTFTVNLFSDFDKYMNIPLEWTPPNPLSYKDPGNLHYYLVEPDAFDQFTVIHADRVSMWLNSTPDPVFLEERTRWTETTIKWSPQGTYMATFHQRGIALWGGEKFKQIVKFSHVNVEYLDFSPSENYVITFNPVSGDNRKEKDEAQVIVWDILTGNKKRSFSIDRSHTWPMFKWSHDDKFFARLGSDSVLSVYETPSCGLLDKKSIKVSGMRDFTWSPTDNVIALWVPEDKDVPARVCLLEIPSRNELRAKNLFNVANCQMHWQRNGDYLCVKVDRYSKVKKEKDETKYSGMYYNLEIFDMRVKEIPVDSVEIKEVITAFGWEPCGSKFGLIHGEQPNITASFYFIKPGGNIQLIKKLERRQCNHLFWAPSGQFVVLASLHSSSGTLEFIDTNDMTVMAVGEHPLVSNVEWDPTGRYVVTAVSTWHQKIDTGYWLWSFQGRILRRVVMDGFCQLKWRPRPPSLLSAEQIREIKKNLKKYIPQFDMDDRRRATKASKELIDKRRQQVKEFEEYRQRKLEEYNSLRDERLRLRKGVDTDDLSTAEAAEEETIEFFVKEEIINLESD